MDAIQKAFEQLGLDRDASLKEVRRAYRNLVRSWHPDRFSDNPQLQQRAQERLKEINAAYQLARKNISVLREPATGIDSPFRFDSAFFTPGQVTVVETASPPATNEKAPQKKLQPSVVAAPFSLNLLFIILTFACFEIARQKFGISIQGILYFFQTMAVPFICAVACNTSFGVKKGLRAGYFAAIVLFGAMVAIDAFTLKKEVHLNIISGSSEEEPEAVRGGRGGGLSGPSEGSSFGPSERSFPTGPRAPESPVAPASPSAPSPLQPSPPMSPRAK